MNTTSVAVTAGLGGFLVVFALALAVWFLGRDLTRRLRRMRVAEDKRLEREAQARQAQRPPPGKEPGEQVSGQQVPGQEASVQEAPGQPPRRRPERPDGSNGARPVA